MGFQRGFQRARQQVVRLLIVACALTAAALGTAALTALVRSYFARDILSCSRYHWRAGNVHRTSWWIQSNYGVLSACYAVGRNAPREGERAADIRKMEFGSTPPSADQGVGAGPSVWRKLGFGFETAKTDNGYRYTASTPLGLLCLLGLPAPALWLRGVIRRRRRERLAARGCCTRCGYDLRAQSERCPECGAAVEDAKRGTQNVERKTGRVETWRGGLD
jgi:hypothetical protein